MGRPRASERFDWSDARVMRLKGYLAINMRRKDIARTLGCSERALRTKIDELQVEPPKVRWAGGPKPGVFDRGDQP